VAVARIVDDAIVRNAIDDVPELAAPPEPIAAPRVEAVAETVARTRERELTWERPLSVAFPVPSAAAPEEDDAQMDVWKTVRL
jgi:hypothetical protein